MNKSRYFRTQILSQLMAFALLFWQSACFAADILTPLERAWLEAHPEIRVAVSPDYPPIGFIDANGVSIGLSEDYLKLIEKRLDIRFTRVVLPLALRSAKSPEEKQVDMISTFAITEERLQYWNFTKTYLDFPVYIIAHEDAPINFSLNNTVQSVSAVGHYAVYDYLKQHYPNVHIDKVDDTCKGLQNVSLGISVGMVADLPVANWCVSTLAIKNLKIVDALDFHYKMSIATRKDWPILSGILEKGLSTITQHERDEIYLLWNKNLLEKSKFEQYKYWVFASVLSLLALLLFRLHRWDNNLKESLDKRLTDAHLLESEKNQRLAASKKIMQTNILAFVLMVLIIIAIFAFTFDYFEKNHNRLLSIIELAVVAMGLFGGFTLGSMWRRYEADVSFMQLQNQTQQREVAEQQLTQIEQRQVKQQQALITLTRSQLRPWQDAEDVYREIAQIAAETLEAERAGIWLFDENQQQLDSMCLFVRSKQLHTVAKPLLAKQLPQYFKYLTEQRVIAADDAYKHPATAEFLNGYLQDGNIGALLDGTIWLNDQVVGVVCIEHVGGSREWTLDEQNFVGSLTDYCRLIIETCRRREAELALIQLTEQQEETIAERTRSLLESESRYSYVVENAPIPILVMSSNGKIVDANPEALLAGNYKREDVIGKNFIETIVAKESRKNALVTAALALKGKDFRDVELLLQSADGKKVEYLCSIGTTNRTTSTGEGEMVAIAQDISQQKALQSTLIKAREAAESADRIKSMFVASMSHELRTPLNSIIGFLGVVLQGMSGELNVKQKDQLGRAYHSAKHLLALISDVIDISKIEAGYLTVYIEQFELKQLMLEVEHAVQHLATDKHLRLIIDCPDKITLETDRKRFYQVVLNVVSNALKYTEQGKVNVAASIKKDQLYISVADTGIGIAEADLPNLFKPFERVESRLKIKTLGTGLGLYLTRKILTQLLAGDIQVKSELEVGSTFTIRVPIKLHQTAEQAIPSILEDNHL